MWEPLGGALGVAFAAGHFKGGRLDGVADLLQGAGGLGFCGDRLGVVENSAERYVDGWEIGE